MAPPPPKKKRTLQKTNKKSVGQVGQFSLVIHVPPLRCEYMLSCENLLQIDARINRKLIDVRFIQKKNPTILHAKTERVLLIHT